MRWLLVMKMIQMKRQALVCQEHTHRYLFRTINHCIQLIILVYNSLIRLNDGRIFFSSTIIRLFMRGHEMLQGLNYQKESASKLANQHRYSTWCCKFITRISTSLKVNLEFRLCFREMFSSHFE